MKRPSTGQYKFAVMHSVHTWLHQTENWIYTAVKSLPKEVENHIFCEMTKNLDQFSIPNIHSFANAPLWQKLWDNNLRRLGIRCYLGYLADLAKRCHAKILHSHFGNVGWVNIDAAKRAKLKHVVSFYGFDASYLPHIYPVWRERFRVLFNQSHRILCEGPHMAQCLMKLGCPGNKIRVHHLGVELDQIPFKPRIWQEKEPLCVLIAASFQEKKGIPYALEALGNLQQSVPLSITIIGGANDEARSQAEKQKIIATIEKYKLQNKIRMLGYLQHDNLIAEAYKHHIFLSPSVTASDGDAEGGAPVTLIEMAATGMPVVSTMHCDIPQIIQHERTGLLATERDVSGLVAHLKWLIEHPDGWLAMVEACRKHLDAQYDSRKQGARLGEIYRELVES